MTQHMADSQAASDEIARRAALHKLTTDNQAIAAAKRTEDAARKPSRL